MLKKRSNRAYRTCTPCPHDMLKKHTNMGIKWICAGYQRARRTFKSECMMRFRNCQDGTCKLSSQNIYQEFIDIPEYYITSHSSCVEYSPFFNPCTLTLNR